MFMSVVASKLFSYFTISPIYPHERLFVTALALNVIAIKYFMIAIMMQEA
jgi:hypothetical protein